MAGPILIFVEAREGKVKRASLEAVSEASRIAPQVGASGAVALLVGNGVHPLAAEVGTAGASYVLVVDKPEFKPYAPEGFARAVAEAVRKVNARAVFLSSTAMGKDLAPTVAAHFGVSVATDCTGLSAVDGQLQVRRPVYAGKTTVTLRFLKEPWVLTLRPNVFPLQKGGTAPKVEDLPFEVRPEDLRSAVREVVATGQGKVELTEAGTIVSGGRGLKGPENFGLRDQLAEVLGAAVGASRAVVDAGWRPHAEQVGQTGKTVSPNLYVAIGISGAIQHLAGMSSSKVIVAINKDPDAPIFKVASYGIVGDAFEVVPEFTRQLKTLLHGSP
jgi:electron transfer flavoprotein alpha subunit